MGLRLLELWGLSFGRLLVAKHPREPGVGHPVVDAIRLITKEIRFLNRLTGRKPRSEEKREMVIPAEAILYMFQKSALTQDLILSSTVLQEHPRTNSVCLRTTNGVFISHFRFLSELLEILNPVQFRDRFGSRQPFCS